MYQEKGVRKNHAGYYDRSGARHYYHLALRCFRERDRNPSDEHFTSRIFKISRSEIAMFYSENALITLF